MKVVGSELGTVLEIVGIMGGLNLSAKGHLCEMVRFEK